MDRRALPRQGSGGALRLDPGSRPRPGDLRGPSERDERLRSPGREWAGSSRPLAGGAPCSSLPWRSRPWERAFWLAPRLRGNKTPALPNWVQVGFRRGTRLVRTLRPRRPDHRLQRRLGWRSGAPFLDAPEWTTTRTLDLPPGKILSISSKNELAFLRDPHFVRFSLSRALLCGPGWKAVPGATSSKTSWRQTGLPTASNSPSPARSTEKSGWNIRSARSSTRPIKPSATCGFHGTAWIAFFERVARGTVTAVRVSDGFRRVLSEGWFTAVGLAWSADGQEIWFTPQKQVRDTSPPLLAVTLSGKLREVFRGPGQMRLFDIASDGRSLVARWDLQAGVRSSSPSS